MSTLEIQAVSKTIHRHTVLHPIDLALNKGEFIAIIGPSGSGKSTLLRIIAGLETPSTGEIRINGQIMNLVAPAKRDIAMVFQDYALYPHMTVYDNMAYGLKMRKCPHDEIRERVEQVAKRLALTPHLKKKPDTLSGGQQQRVAMGRALVRKPSLYLFDEPLSNLDVSLRLQLRMEIKQLHQASGITSLYVTHDQIEAMTLASRILVLNHGRIEQFDTPSAIYAKPQNIFVGTFMGLHPMNLIPARLAHATQTIQLHDHLSLPMPALSKPVQDGAQVWIGIRPEEVQVNHDKKPTLGLDVNEVLIDEMGVDMLVRVQCSLTERMYLIRQSIKKGHPNTIRQISFDHGFCGHLFLASSGERIGGWHEASTD